ncbi:MAG: type IV pilin protein [Pseudomonadota bacterium]
MQHAYRSQGFTIVELVVVVAIIGILAAIAYPSFQQSAIKSKRGAAVSCLLEQVQFMERFYSTNLRYDQTTAGVAVALPAGGCRTALETAPASYLFSFTATPTARAFTIQAVPQGAQATGDAACGTLTINQAGVKTASGTQGAAFCWKS